MAKGKKTPIKAKPSKTSGSGFFKKALISLAAITILTLIGGTAITYFSIFRNNVYLGDKDEDFIYIKTGSQLEDVVSMLNQRKIIINNNTFTFFAEIRNYKGKAIRPGKYKIKKGMTNFELIRLLKSGTQEPVKLVLSNARTKEQLAGIIAHKLEADSLSLISLMNDHSFLYPFGFNPDNVIGMFIPNTYEFYWNTTAEAFFEKMEKEYAKFWTETRKRKAAQMNLTPGEVATLASIVEKETNFNPEKKTIAGVYLNRIKKGMPLQADPTVVFAVGDFSIRRVTGEHTSINSPYNTYKVLGLPPGPICMPGQASLNAVLNAEDHEYLYFCAKGDGSGSHLFAANHDDHMRNARQYHRTLNQRGIH